MSNRLQSTILGDIINSINKIEVYVSDLNYEKFIENFMIVEACLYNIQLMGEAVSHLKDQIKNSEPDVPWTLMKGMRNRLIHEYFGTDLNLVWNVIKNELPALKNQLTAIRLKLISEGI